MNTLGQRIKSRRKELGLTLDQLAALAGTKKQTINHYETGFSKAIRMDLLFRLADALRVSPRYLATGKDGLETFPLQSEAERELIVAYRTLPEPLQSYLVQTSVSLATSVVPSPPFPKPPSTPSSVQKAPIGRKKAV